MEIKQLIDLVQNTSNAVCCNHCGRKHIIEMRLESDNTIRYHFEAGTCEDYKQAVIESAAKLFNSEGYDFMAML